MSTTPFAIACRLLAALSEDSGEAETTAELEPDHLLTDANGDRFGVLSNGDMIEYLMDKEDASNEDGELFSDGMDGTEWGDSDLYDNTSTSVNAYALVLSGINESKPYKPRRLKNDTGSRLARQAYKHKSKQAGNKQKRDRYRKMYVRKNKPALQRRSKFVRKQRKMLQLD